MRYDDAVLSDDERRRLVDKRAEQGLPAQLEDESIARRVAALVRPSARVTQRAGTATLSAAGAAGELSERSGDSPEASRVVQSG